MRKSIVLGLSLMFACLVGSEALADSWCNTRNYCFSWRPRYVANARVGCWEISGVVPLCSRKQARCDSASAVCSRSCLSGSAVALAINGSAGCTAVGSRSGLGWYGEEPQNPAGGLENARGDHEVRSRIEFNNDTRNIDIIFDSLTMTATVDQAYSRVDVWVYLEPATETKEEPEPTPENTYWHGYLLSQNGRLTQEGFDELADQLTNDGEITSLDVADFVKTISYIGSQEDFENLAVRIAVDGGIPEEGDDDGTSVR